MNDRLSALRLFARAARVGNFSSAGRELGLSQPSAPAVVLGNHRLRPRDVGAKSRRICGAERRVRDSEQTSQGTCEESETYRGHDDAS
jgi:hypothetical protein